MISRCRQQHHAWQQHGSQQQHEWWSTMTWPMVDNDTTNGQKWQQCQQWLGNDDDDVTETATTENRWCNDNSNKTTMRWWWQLWQWQMKIQWQHNRNNVVATAMMRWGQWWCNGDGNGGNDDMTVILWLQLWWQCDGDETMVKAMMWKWQLKLQQSTQ